MLFNYTSMDGTMHRQDQCSGFIKLMWLMLQSVSQEVVFSVVGHKCVFKLS